MAAEREDVQQKQCTRSQGGDGRQGLGTSQYMTPQRNACIRTKACRYVRKIKCSGLEAIDTRILIFASLHAFQELDADLRATFGDDRGGFRDSPVVSPFMSSCCTFDGVASDYFTHGGPSFLLVSAAV